MWDLAYLFINFKKGIITSIPFNIHVFFKNTKIRYNKHKPVSLFCQWTLHVLLNFISDNETEKYTLGLELGIPTAILLTIIAVLFMYGIHALRTKYGKCGYVPINNVQPAHNNPLGNLPA